MARRLFFLLSIFASLALAVYMDHAKANGVVLRHDIRDLMELDSIHMVRMVDKEYKTIQDLDSSHTTEFHVEAGKILAQTIMPQVHFTEREAAIRFLKGKIEPQEYPVILKNAVQSILESEALKGSPRDQATAIVALLNLVIEIRSQNADELKDVLKAVADADISVGADAKRYAGESMHHLVSPSAEAKLALAPVVSTNSQD